MISANLLSVIFFTSFFPNFFFPMTLWSSDFSCASESVGERIQFSSVAQSCPTLCDHMDCSTPGVPVHHRLPELAQTHVHRVVDVIKPRAESLLNVLGTTLRISDSASLGWEARVCVSDRFPGVALAAGPESILWESLVFAIYKSWTFVYS